MNGNKSFWSLFGITAFLAFLIQILGLGLVGFALWMVGRYFHVV
jgi:hypothetical protein